MIPDWIIKYDKANYQSGAGKAVRELISLLTEKESQLSEAKADRDDLIIKLDRVNAELYELRQSQSKWKRPNIDNL